MVILISKEAINAVQLQKLGNQSMLNSALVIEMKNNSFSSSKKNFGRFIRRGTF